MSTHSSIKYVEDAAMVWIDLSFTGSAMIGLHSNIILNSISGYIKFGSLNALMGPSGSGKTTFLKCINGQNNGGLSKETELYLNKKKEIRPCFIVQDVSEHLLNGLTAKQTLMYASKLKNSDEDFKVDHKNNIKKLMEDLMISDTADTRIDKCSGGEQKRIAIAAELTAIKMPNLLCIDEPTSGLDSNAAEIVIRCLKNLAIKHHIAIVTSIHQPNADILLMYDQLYVLAKGGKCVFSGPPQEVRDHLKLSSIEYNSYQIPLEVLIKCSSKGLKDADVIELMIRNYDRNKYDIERYKQDCSLSSGGVQTKTKSFRVSNFWHLFIRCLINTVKYQWFSLLIQSLIIGNYYAVLALIGYQEIGKVDGCVTIGNELHNVTDTEFCATAAETLRQEFIINQNILAVGVLSGFIEFLQVVATTVTLASEIKIFLNEHRNGWYSTSSYYWAKSLVELPLPVVVSIYNVYLGYKLTDQIDESRRFAGVAFFTVVGVLCIQSYGFLSCILFGWFMPLALILSIFVFIVFLLFCDSFIPILELNAVLQFFSHGSVLRQVVHSSWIYIYGLDRCPTGTVSWALQQFDLHIDESFKLKRNYVIILVHLILIRLITLIVMIVIARPKHQKSSKAIVETIEEGEYDGLED